MEEMNGYLICMNKFAYNVYFYAHIISSDYISVICTGSKESQCYCRN